MPRARAITTPLNFKKSAAVIKTLAVTLTAAFALTGCSKYQMTVNETVVYTPPTVLTDFDTEDPRLKDCLDQTIKDLQATDLAQVTQLICSHAGLSSLKGLEAFYNIQRLNLGNNQLTELEPIKYLSKLEVLLLNDNQLVKTPELLNLPKLTRVSLDNNPAMECGDAHQLQRISSAEVTLPNQCR
mgnify:CR=1 FL=1|tara:strand:- start:40680 stop:41234 length:555 start_codon:yes stop_codon:yes gene_type:complete